MRFLEHELAAYLAERGEDGGAADFVDWLDLSLSADPIASLDLSGGGATRRSGRRLDFPAPALVAGPPPVAVSLAHDAAPPPAPAGPAVGIAQAYPFGPRRL